MSLPIVLLTAALFSAAPTRGDEPRPPGTVRVATFNASLYRSEAGQLARDLASPDDPQARAVAEIIRRVRPDVLLVNEFDYDSEGRAAALFQRTYLSRPIDDVEPIVYPHRFVPEVNTGVPSGFDLDNDGMAVTEPGDRRFGNDAIGYGAFPGQYGMVVYSRFPIDAEGIRSFRMILWREMPGALLPTREDGSPWYSVEELAVLRLSSKTHVDVPIRIDGTTLHLLASHPTPPAFDGPERRNVRRNHDEIRLWADYLAGGGRAAYLDPTGRGRPPEPPELFVILGDLNADPADGSGAPEAIAQLLEHPKVDASVVPSSRGGAEASALQGGANARHRGDPAHDTGDFGDDRVGNLRIDYVLPSRGLRVVDAGIVWPTRDDPLHRLVEMDPPASSDHRLVWIDLRLPARSDGPRPERP